MYDQWRPYAEYDNDATLPPLEVTFGNIMRMTDTKMLVFTKGTIPVCIVQFTENSMCSASQKQCA